ncbi:MAG: ATP-binding protein [Gaiellaceae bacterium]
MNPDLRQLREVEVWIAWVRVAGVAFAVFELTVFTQPYPPGYERYAWITTAAFGAGATVIFWLGRWLGTAKLRILGFTALAFDTAVIAAYATIFSYEYGSPTRWALMLVVVEAALRYGLVGGIAMPIALVPFFTFLEWWRAHRFGPPSFLDDRVSFPAGIHLLTGSIVGWLVARLRTQSAVAELRAVEAEGLRDELGRRADALDAASRCARALNSSLELDEAFAAFIRELRGVILFERMAIVLSDDGRAQVMAVAGRGADELFPPGTSRPFSGSLLEQVLASAQTAYREDMSDERFPEEGEFAALGLRCRVAAPLLVGPRAIGMVSIVRAEPGSFAPDEIELVGLLGRLVGSAVQNIRAYESERRTVEELRRLSALRADFVALVSHELRTPMASVIGSARTLQQRWRELTPEQRDAFLALIADETARLAALVGDVLDTSRIDAGTFGYTFTNVDVGELVHESVATAGLSQDEVHVQAEVPPALPVVRGDPSRLRQVLTNLIDNAVKYSPVGGEVAVRAYGEDTKVLIAVRDQGPGIAKEDQKLIFEKFGRVDAPGVAKPGTGLGLFIARSIAEAHGGSLEVTSVPERGAMFTLSLPAEA